MGLVFQPVKQQGLAAAAGTTPFDVLFLAFSCFMIAAVMLAALLFRLGNRAPGGRDRHLAGRRLPRGRSPGCWPPRAVGRRRREPVGRGVGVGYAAILLAGLETWWLAADRHSVSATARHAGSLAIGYASGLLIAMLAILPTVRRVARVAPRRLLAGETSDDIALAELRVRSPLGDPRHRHCSWLLLLICPGVVLTLVAAPSGRAGRGVFRRRRLALARCWCWSAFGSVPAATGTAVAVGRGNLLRLALRNAARTGPQHAHHRLGARRPPS